MKFKCARIFGYLTAIELSEEIIHVCCNDIDNPFFQGLARRGGYTLAYGILCPLLVSAALSRDTLRICHSIVGDLFHHGLALAFFFLGLADINRVGCPDIRPRGHGCNVRGKRDDGTG